jgi:eukaryotic-like serine/threonine-protein kinase
MAGDDEEQPTSPGVDDTRAESPHARTPSSPFLAPKGDGEGGGRSVSLPRRGSEQDRTAPGLGGSGAGTSGPSATAARALHSAELMRARAFALMIGVLSLAAMVPCVLVWLEETATPRWLQVATAGSLFSTGVLGVVLVRATRNPQRAQALLRVFGILCVVTALMVQLYAGVFSPAPALIALGISYYGLIDDRPLAATVCIGATVGYAVLTALVLSGLLPDVGLFAALTAPLVVKLAVMGTVLACFFFMFWQTRESRNATRQAVERLDEALRLVQEREALLDEANQHLDLALAAGGRRGGFSGRNMGPYRLGELLGRGGMGEVYAAAHQHTAAHAAIKLLPASAAAQPDLVQRFLREAELARRLRSPNLVEILELGQSDDGIPYLAMEHLIGHDLGWHLRRSGRMTLADVVILTSQVAAGLEIAHAAGVVHRDLKPANLFRVEQPGSPEALWKILDFGVAKLKGSHGTLTQHALVGTPGYMSPEQAQSREVDARSDLFSLATVVYRAITGRPAFSAPDTPQVLFDVVYRSPARPSALLMGLPQDVDLVLAIALAKDPEARFATAAELATALDAAARGVLPQRTRVRGESVVRALPWGKTVRPRD